MERSNISMIFPRFYINSSFHLLVYLSLINESFPIKYINRRLNLTKIIANS